MRGFRRRAGVPLVCHRCFDSGIRTVSASEGPCDCSTGSALAAWLAENPERTPYDWCAPAYELMVEWEEGR